MTNRTPSIPKTVSSAGAVSTNVRKSPSNSMKISRVWKAECARLLGPLPKASARRRTGREFGIKGRENLPSYAESHACVPCLRRSGFAQAGEAHFGAQARVFRPWMNAGRVPFEAPKERSRVCFGGFRLPARNPALRDEGRPDEACGGATGFSPWGSTCSLLTPFDTLPYLL